MGCTLPAYCLLKPGIFYVSRDVDDGGQEVSFPKPAALRLQKINSGKPSRRFAPEFARRRPGSLNWQDRFHDWTLMLVKTQSKGRAYAGVTIGAGNVRRYFPKRMDAIELALDDLQIQCELTPEFWDGPAEISDWRLCAWLELKNSRGLPGHPPIPLALIPCGNNSFRLIAARPHDRSRKGPSPPE